MPRQPMPGPDPLHPIRSSTDELRASLESDFADLAARFAEKSGGGLSPELSAELALEIVLNEIVEHACLATGASGAAIVLQRDGELVCRASSGSTAPELGARLETSSGLSGECIKTRRTQRCHDVLADERADVEASQRLGVRSVMVMPLLRGTEFAGVFELFSARPYAFGDRDERTLELLADRTLSNLERMARRREGLHEVGRDEVGRDEVRRGPEAVVREANVREPAVPEPRVAERSVPERSVDRTIFDRTSADRTIVDRASEDVRPEVVSENAGPAGPSGIQVVIWILGAVVVACAILLGVLAGRHFGLQPRTAHTNLATMPASAGAAAGPTPADPSGRKAEQSGAASPQASPQSGTQSSTQSKPKSDSSVPAGGLRVFDNGKEVFRMPAETSDEQKHDQSASEEPAKVVELSPATAEGSLLHRVEPEYPEEARQQNIQGHVVLDVHMAVDGTVQDVRVVSGPQPLAQVSTEAVKQWRFKPRTVSGRPVEMQTRITLNFRLPQ